MVGERRSAVADGLSGGSNDFLDGLGSLDDGAQFVEA